MSCDGRRRKFWRNSLRLSAEDQRSVERVYASAGLRVYSEDVTPPQRAEWTAKTIRLATLFKAYGVPPPIHGRDGVPKSAEALAGYAAIWDWLDNRGLTNTVRRPGLPVRLDGGWERGQLTDEEFEFFQRLAGQRDKPLILTGSLIETNLGMGRRYDPRWQKYLSCYRRRKPRSSLVDRGELNDIDIAEVSALSPSEVTAIQGRFPRRPTRYNWLPNQVVSRPHIFSPDGRNDLSPRRKGGADHQVPGKSLGWLAMVANEASPAATMPPELQALVLQLHQSDYASRCAAADQIGKTRDQRAIPALIQALGDDNPHDEESRVNRHVASALASIGDAAIRPLVQLLQHRDAGNWRRYWAAEALGMIGGEQALPALMAALATDNDPGVVEGTANALGRMGRAIALPSLQRRMQTLSPSSGRAYSAVQEAIRSLTATGSAAA